MLGKFGVEDVRVWPAPGEEDARSIALLLMLEALAQLDSDSKIPVVIGAHLQTAIDALWTNACGDQHSVQLH